MEVLIAMFVLAIGMLGILALFPLGAAQMAQAIKDERSAQLADIGEGHMRVLWRQFWLNQSTGGENSPSALPAWPEFTSLGMSSTSPTPSTPIYIDPMGYNSQPAGYQTAVAGLSSLPRKDLTVISGLGVAGRIRMFALMDDLTFNSQGLAAPTSRGDRYSSAYLIQLPKNNFPQEVNLKVIVYQGRSPDSASTETPITLSGSVTPGNDSIPFTTSGVPLRLNSWILLTNTTPEPFADFYRVVGITPTQVSVSPPIRTHGTTGAAYSAYGAILDNVVEVFDRGTITPLAVAAP